MGSAIKEMKSELSERIEGKKLLLVGDSGSPLLRGVGISQDSRIMGVIQAEGRVSVGTLSLERVGLSKILEVSEAAP